MRTADVRDVERVGHELCGEPRVGDAGLADRVSEHDRGGEGADSAQHHGGGRGDVLPAPARAAAGLTARRRDPAPLAEFGGVRRRTAQQPPPPTTLAPMPSHEQSIVPVATASRK
jgi:hypothetical protein